jgi:hypothetical protein
MRHQTNYPSLPTHLPPDDQQFLASPFFYHPPAGPLSFANTVRYDGSELLRFVGMTTYVHT